MIIDTHFHAFPGKFLELVPEAQNDVRGRGLSRFRSPGVSQRHGSSTASTSVSSPIPAGESRKGGDRAKALELCRILNDSFADAHAKYPHRFKAFARLPMVDMDDCVRELERCYKDLKMHGVMMPTNVGGQIYRRAGVQAFLGCAWRRVASRCFSIRPTRRARPTGTSIRCIKRFSGRPTALWQSRASSMLASSIATRTSSSSPRIWAE